MTDGNFGLEKSNKDNIVELLRSLDIIDKAQISFYINNVNFDEITQIQRNLESSSSSSEDDSEDDETEVLVPESHVGFGGWDEEVIQNV